MIAAGQAHRFQCRGGQGRRQGGGVDVGACGLGKVLDQVFATQHQRAGTAQRLAQGDQLQRHVVHAQAGVGDCATAIAEHAYAMRVVHVEQRLLQARDQRQRTQRCNIAVHAEDTIGGQHRRTLGCVLELAHGAFRIQVRVAAQARTGQPRGIEQAGVVELVLHADIVLFAQQRLLHRQVGGEATAEQQGARVTEPVGQFAFQRVVQRVVATDQMRGTGTGAIACGRILQRVDHAELLGQAEVVVAAEPGQPAPVNFQAHAITTGDRAPRAATALCIAQRALGLEAGGQVGAGHAGFRRRRGG